MMEPKATHDIEKLIAEVTDGGSRLPTLLEQRLAGELLRQTAKVRELEAIVERVRVWVNRSIVWSGAASGDYSRGYEKALTELRALLAPQETAACDYCDTETECQDAKMCLGSLGSPDQPPPAQARGRLAHTLAQFGGAVANYASGNYPLGKGFAIVEEHAARVANRLYRDTDHAALLPAQQRERLEDLEDDAIQTLDNFHDFHHKARTSDTHELWNALKAYIHAAAREGK